MAEKSGESEVTVSFDAVAEGMNGGYVDAENVRYIGDTYARRGGDCRRCRCVARG